MKKRNNKQRILLRYSIVVALAVLLALAIVMQLFKTTVIEAGDWNSRARRELSRIDTIPPERGNILADNGNILACNLKVYDIKLDLRHDKVKCRVPIPWDQIDALADSLDAFCPRVEDLHASQARYEEYSWRTRLRREFERDPDRRTRALRLAKKRTLEDFERVRNFPYLRDFEGRGFRIPVYKEERTVRIYPYGRMANRSIGRVNEDSVTGEFHGYSGLEKDLDSLLYGQPGLAKKTPMTNGINYWVTQPARRGYDIVTTIDIDLQDMLEQELNAVCEEAHAEWGTAILMEVETGEIKAISNLERLDDGTYGEALNRAVMAFEPGSVMKPISLMIAFEDGLVKSVNDCIDCSPFQRTNDPHGAPVKSLKQIIEMSSNTGIARVIFRGYASHPEKFYDRLSEIGFFEPMHTGIAEETPPRIRRLVDHDSRGNNITMTARHLDLARQAYGYNTVIPPLYTLSIYNAIANKGRYVRPRLIKALRGADGRDSVIKPSYIRDRICSEATADKVGQCIHEVVWGDHGTARLVRDDRVKVVGKTGTAYPVGPGGYDKSRRRYAFAGYFPYESPRYSCMALVLAPGGNSANRTSGQVVKNIALKMYARGMLGNVSRFTDSRSDSRPVFTASDRSSGADLRSDIGVSSARRMKADRPRGTATVPDVRGYDAPSAIRILEQRGLNVVVRGSGRVVRQSIDPLTAVRRGEKIILELKI